MRKSQKVSGLASFLHKITTELTFENPIPVNVIVVYISKVICVWNFYLAEGERERRVRVEKRMNRKIAQHLCMDKPHFHIQCACVKFSKVTALGSVLHTHSRADCWEILSGLVVRSRCGVGVLSTMLISSPNT